MKLPILISVPHAGLRVPPEAQPYCRLSECDIIADSDEGAGEIYDLAGYVARFITTDIARAIIDLNRSADDRRADGVVKTETIWKVPVYDQTLPADVVAQLLERYYHPYHRQLGDPSAAGVKLCVDCHTMAAVAPPIDPNAGSPRPAVCLGDGDGTSLPDGWIEVLAQAFNDEFRDFQVTVNEPFSGGYITCQHGRERPWLQIEISRAPFLSNMAKRERVLRALRQFCDRMFDR